MQVDKVMICRICLKICQDGFNNIDKNTHEALNFLLLHVNLDITHDLVICTTCIKDLKKCFDFKSDCLQKRNSKCTKPRNTNISGLSAYMRESIVESGSSISNIDICVFCLEMVNLNSSLLLKNEESNVTLEKYFPELDLNITENSITCQPCYKSMQILVSFINSCLAAEERIQEYCNIEGTNGEGQIELAAVLNFTFKDQLKSFVHGFNLAKVEDQLECEGKIEIKSEDYVEIEEHRLLGIKEEFGIKTEDDNGRSKNGIEEDMKIYGIKAPVFFKCRTCSYQTYSNQMLRRHASTCKYVAQYQDNLSKHILTRKSTSELRMSKCDKCPYQSKFRQSLRVHMLTHTDSTEVTMHRCKVCTHQSKYKHSMWNHMLTHKSTSEMKMFKCDKCPFQCKRNSGLQRHSLVHKSTSEVTMYKCEACTFETKRKDHLGGHMLIHKSTTEIKMHKCKLCVFQTKHKDYLPKHMLTHKSTSEVRMFKCDKCPYQSKFRQSLQLHMFTHVNSTEVTMHKCKICTYQTKYKYAMGPHMLTHKSTSEVRMFKCDMCPHQSKRKKNLRQHMLTHKDSAETTMYKCNMCAYQTKYKHAIRPHMLSHKCTTEVKMYKCELCAFQTRYKGNVPKHMLTHKSTSKVEMLECDASL